MHNLFKVCESTRPLMLVVIENFLFAWITVVSSPYFFALSMVEVTEYIQDGVPFCMLFYGIVLLYE